MLGHAPASPLVASKRARLSRPSEDLDAIKITREEGRRTNQRAADREVRGREEVTVRSKGRTASVVLINLSGGGAMIEGRLNARLWDKVTLILGEHGAVECAVRWIRDDRLGLEFAHETRIDCAPGLRDETLRQVIEENFAGSAGSANSADPSARASKRQAARHPMIWSGMIHYGDESAVARLRNISSSGALIQTTGNCATDDVVKLDLGNAGVVNCRVCWTVGDQIGVAFDKEFDLRRLAACKPEIASSKWAKPDYLRDENSDTSPWASQWGRLTLAELGRTLAG